MKKKNTEEFSRILYVFYISVKYYKVIYFKPGAYKYMVRLIPQGTVDNNLGPDRLEGPKALA